MNTLLVDIGNTRVKWATLAGGAPRTVRAAAHGGKAAALSALVRRAPRGITRVLAVSVVNAKLERALAAAVRAKYGVRAEFVRSARSAAGVRNGYREVWRLGADRWVSVIGAHALARGRAVVVANAGTALTVDAVSGAGRHQGGVIVPGAQTLVAMLLAGTHGIRRRARGVAPSTRTLFAADTASAIAAGAEFAAAALIDRAVLEAARRFGGKPLLILTGGGAVALRRHLRTPARLVPDLVLRGLARLARG